MLRILDVAVEKWPIAGRFAIARGAKTEAEVVVVTIREGGHLGRGESVPYARYGETIDGTVASIESNGGRARQRPRSRGTPENNAGRRRPERD